VTLEQTFADQSARYSARLLRYLGFAAAVALKLTSSVALSCSGVTSRVWSLHCFKAAARRRHCEAEGRGATVIARPKAGVPPSLRGRRPWCHRHREAEGRGATVIARPKAVVPPSLRGRRPWCHRHREAEGRGATVIARPKAGVPPSLRGRRPWCHRHCEAEGRGNPELWRRLPSPRPCCGGRAWSPRALPLAMTAASAAPGLPRRLHLDCRVGCASSQ